MIDIENERIVIKYLKGKELIKEGQKVQIKKYGGGVSCKVVKIITKDSSFVIKQALYKLRVKDNWYSDISRVITERKCLRVYNKIVPGYVPNILYYDDKNYLFIMESATNGSVPWKSLLLKGEIDYSVGEKVSYALAKVHEVSSRDLLIKEQFKDDRFFIELRIEPYLETIKGKHPSLSGYVDEAIKYLLDHKTVLVHGDYSPKNILVSKNGIFILDFEVAHWGNPAFDLAFLTNHLLLKSIKNKKWLKNYLKLMDYMVEVYFENRDIVNRVEIERETIIVLALLFLARVDGKSPAEYITEENDKKIIRELSFNILKNSYSKYRQLINLFTDSLQQ